MASPVQFRHDAEAPTLAEAERKMPFWRRMPLLFSFPAHRGPLARNLIVSVVLAGIMAAQAWLAASVFAMAAAIYLAHYGFVIIERIAQGFLQPEQFPAGARMSWRPLKLAAILFVSFLAIGLVNRLTGDGVLTLLADAAAALLLPASVMTLAVTNNLREAIDPRRLFDFARKIGWPYVALFLALLLLMGGSQQAFDLVAPVLGKSPWLLGLAGSFVGNYFFFIMCAMMGYVLFQYSDALSLNVVGPGDPEPAELLGEGEFHRRDAILGRLLAEGDLAAAKAHLVHELTFDPDNASLRTRLEKLEAIEKRLD
jgi:hypothetical protein